MMIFSVLFIGMLVLGITPQSSAQGDTISGSEYVPPPLFESNDLLDVIIAFDINTVLRDIGDDRKYHDALFSYLDENGDTVELKTRIRTRGNYRRNPSHCNFPPLRIDFSDADIEHTLYENQAKLNLVTHRITRKKYYEECLLKEYLAYRLYNLITDSSYRVRLLRVK